MTITRPDIRRELLDRSLWKNTGYGNMVTATPQSITAPWLGIGGDPQGKYSSRYLLLDENEAVGDRVRRGAKFDGKLRRLTHAGPDYSAAPTVSAERFLEIHRFHPDDLHNAINLALTRRCFELQHDVITPDGSSIYTLGTTPFNVFDGIPGDEDPDQHILDVENAVGTGADAYYTPWADTQGRVFHGFVVDGVLTIEFQPNLAANVRVTWKRPYSELNNDTATVDCPLKYAVEATLFELYSARHGQGVAEGENVEGWFDLRATAEASMDTQRRFALGKWGTRIRRKHQPRSYTHAPGSGLRRRIRRS